MVSASAALGRPSQIRYNYSSTYLELRRAKLNCARDQWQNCACAHQQILCARTQKEKIKTLALSKKNQDAWNAL